MSILEMKVPSPGESITEVEIATWLVKDGDYVEKDQPIAEVDSDKATLELPAEESGIITLKAEEGELVQVGQVVCLIDREGKKPEGAAEEKPASKSDEIPAETPKPEVKKEEPKTQATYVTGTPSPAAKKILEEMQPILHNSITAIYNALYQSLVSLTYADARSFYVEHATSKIFVCIFFL